MSIPVIAERVGTYKGERKRAGVKFTVDKESQLGSWMKRLDKPEGSSNELNPKAAVQPKASSVKK